MKEPLPDCLPSVTLSINVFKEQNWTIRFNLVQFGPSVSSFVIAAFVRSFPNGLNGSLNLMTDNDRFCSKQLAKLRDTWKFKRILGILTN